MYVSRLPLAPIPSFRVPALFAAFLPVAALLVAGMVMPASAASNETLTLYSGQHQQMVRMLVSAFEKQTGIQVQVRDGEGPELANLLIREGKQTPADAIFTENSPELERLQEKGLLASVVPETLRQIPKRYRSSSGGWVGGVARGNVCTYNARLVEKSSLPACIQGLARPTCASM